MRLLGIASARAVVARLPAVLRTEAGADHALRVAEGLLGEGDGVRPHVGDQADPLVAHVDPLVEALRHLHRACRAEAQAVAGLLLQGGGREGRRGPLGARARVDLRHGPCRRAHRLDQSLHRRLVEDARAGRGEVAGGGVEVAPGGHAGPAQPPQRGVQAALGAHPVSALGALQGGLHVPVHRGVEAGTLALALDQQAHGHALDPPRREAALDLPPEQRGEAVAEEPVQDAPRLLRLHQVEVDLAGGLDGCRDRVAGDFVEDDALHGYRRLQHLNQVPADALAFPVFVGCEEQFVGPFQLLAQSGDVAALLRRDDVDGLKVLLDVDRQFGPGFALERSGALFGAAREVADVPVRRFD